MMMRTALEIFLWIAFIFCLLLLFDVVDLYSGLLCHAVYWVRVWVGFLCTGTRCGNEVLEACHKRLFLTCLILYLLQQIN